MSNRIETEEKFFLGDKLDGLLKIINKMNMKKISELNEIDEYFTDINEEFIKNRTCLRIRKTNNKDMELTFKGKSEHNSSQYSKKETNININISEYDDVLTLLNNLGYNSYVIVNKERVIYSKDENDFTYNIMVDNIKDVGYFVELELLSNNKVDKQTALSKFDKYKKMFDELKLEKSNEPYRDIVASKMLKK